MKHENDIHNCTNERLAEMIEENVTFRFRRTQFGNRLLYFDEFRPDFTGKMLDLEQLVEALREAAARLREKHKYPFNSEAFEGHDKY